MNYEKKQRLIALRDNMKSYGYIDGVEELESIFPELAESEDDRTKKDIINLIYWLKSNPSLCSQYYNDRYDNMLAYLEKQKDILSERAKNITINMLEDGIEGIQRELIEFLSNTINAPWVDVIKSADAYAQRIRSMVEKQKEQKPADRFKEAREKYQVEWSEEDENKIKDIIEYLECWNDFDHGSESFEEYRKRMEGNIQFMKSLRPSWKPSEEQMEHLQRAINYYESDWGENKLLRNLINDLKKLM